MIIVNNQEFLSVDEQLSIIRDTLQSAGIMGAKVAGVIVQDNTRGGSETPMLCLYLDCQTGSIKADNGLPPFPMFFDHWVCEALGQRQLCKVTGMDDRSGVVRWFIEFSSTWI